MPAAPNPAPPAPRWPSDLILLGIAFGLLYFAMLGRAPLANPDEGRYAEIPREMRMSGDWVSPRLNGVPYFEKPPLVYWLVALSQEVFGEGELANRLVPALFALAGVMLTYAAGRALRGRAAGIFSAVVLGTSLIFWVHARILLLDMVMSVLMSATLFCFILAVNQPAGRLRRWLFHGLYVSAALATLAKGLIGFLIPGAVMFLWLLLCREWRRLRPLHLGSGLAIFLGIVVPWHVLAAQHHPEWARFYFVREHFERFFTSVAQREEPWWFFIAMILVGLFPWTGFLWSAVRDSCPGGWRRRHLSSNNWFFVIWVGFILLFFSASSSKLPPYIVPVFPALAFLIGSWFSGAPADPLAAAAMARRLRFGFNVSAFCCGLVAIVLVVIAYRPEVADLKGSQTEMLKRPALAMAAVLVTGGVLAPWLLRLRGLRAGLASMGATAGLFYGIVGYATENIQRPGTTELVAALERVVRPGDRIFHYQGFFHDFVYYSRREVGLISYTDELEVQFLDPATRAARFLDEATFRREWTGLGRIFVVVRRQNAAALFSDQAFRFHLLAESKDHFLISNRQGDE